MKKQLLLATIATILATTTMAQTEIGVGPNPNTVSDDDQHSAYIPAEFTSDNDTKLAAKEGDIINIYDNGLTLIHQINSPARGWDKLYFVDINNMNSPSAILTQTLFNNDNNYEYLVNNYDNNEWIGSSIVSEDGTTIFSWQPSAQGNESHSTFIVKWSNSYYLVTFERDNSNHQRIYTWYRIDRQTQSISRVEGEMPMNVFPSVADRSQTITVELGEGNNATEVQVVNALGQVVKTVPVQSDQREVQLRASDLNGGMHIVGTRTHEGQGACKIIIK